MQGPGPDDVVYTPVAFAKTRTQHEQYPGHGANEQGGGGMHQIGRHGNRDQPCQCAAVSQACVVPTRYEHAQHTAYERRQAVDGDHGGWGLPASGAKQ